MKSRRYFPISKDVAELKNLTVDKEMALAHLKMSMNGRNVRQSFDLKCL